MGSKGLGDSEPQQPNENLMNNLATPRPIAPTNSHSISPYLYPHIILIYHHHIAHRLVLCRCRFALSRLLAASLLPLPAPPALCLPVGCTPKSGPGPK